MPWLLRDGDVLASAEVAASRADRRRGLLGRDHMEGALVLRPCRWVHTVGLRFALDVAFCDRDGVVVHQSSLDRWRVSVPVWRSAFVIEAERGAFERWRLALGDRVEIRE